MIARNKDIKREVKLKKKGVSLSIIVTITMIAIILINNFHGEIKLISEIIEVSISFFILLVILNSGIILFRLLRNK